MSTYTSTIRVLAKKPSRRTGASSATARSVANGAIEGSRRPVAARHAPVSGQHSSQRMTCSRRPSLNACCPKAFVRGRGFVQFDWSVYRENRAWRLFYSAKADRLRVFHSGATRRRTERDPAADRARAAGDKGPCSEERAWVVAKPVKHRGKRRIVGPFRTKRRRAKAYAARPRARSREKPSGAPMSALPCASQRARKRSDASRNWSVGLTSLASERSTKRRRSICEEV